MATDQDVAMEQVDALSKYRTSPLFSDRERAALSYVEEATLPSMRSKKNFSETEIVELTWLNAVRNYYSLINLPLEIESDGLCALAQGRQMAHRRKTVAEAR